MKRRTCSTAGVSIFEVFIAAVVLVIAVTSLYALYGQSLRALKWANESSAANLYFRSQVDTLRSTTWQVLSGTGYGANFVMPSTILPDPTTDPNLSILPSVSLQKLSVISLTSGTTYYSTSRSTGQRSSPVNPISSAIASENALQFLFKLQWSSQGGSYTREYSTVIANPNQ